MLTTCPTCSLILRGLEPPQASCCPRCRHRLPLAGDGREGERTLALAIAALAVYLPAILLPVMTISRLGHRQATGILPGAMHLLSEGKVAIAALILVCSVVIPLAKLAGLIALASDPSWLRREHKGWTWHLVELTGRWSMLDVLLVAILVAALKLGDLVSVEAGPGLWFFLAFVILSLLAGACFNPRTIWSRT